MSYTPESPRVRFKSDKLVRDKLPEIFPEIGITIDARIMEPQEYRERLKNKVLEEALEVVKAENKEELQEEIADLIEVLRALGETQQISFENIEKTRLEKRNEKGGFDKGVYCASIEMNRDHPKVAYYQAQPQNYPEITID